MLWLCQVLWGAGQSHVAGEEEGHQQALEEWGQGQGLAAEGPEVQERVTSHSLALCVSSVWTWPC